MRTQRIFLTGYMGAGKSTLGRLLAEKLHMQFVDLDRYIEERTHRTIAQLFAEGGEEGFRHTEQRLLHEVACFDGVVVATGGGTPCFAGNMELMNRTGITVFLDVPLPCLVDRLVDARSGRPLLAGMNRSELHSFVADALEKRRPFYEQAQLRMDASRLDNADDISRTLRHLAGLLGQDG